METKYDVTEMKWVQRKLDRKQGLVVPCIHQGGGLALLWRCSTTVEVQTYSPNHIDVIISENQGARKWRFTGFYEHPKTSRCNESWTLLSRLSSRSDLPWVCMGDYNELMFASEKEGGNTRPEGQMKQFEDAINRCNLRDLGYKGSAFTWRRRLGNHGWIQERLDHALVFTNWVRMFPRSKLLHIASSTSDHSILLLKAANPLRQKSRRSKLFRFKAMWFKDEACSEVVQEVRARGENRGSQWPIASCLEECQSALMSWNKNIFGHVGRRVTALQQKLQILENLNMGGAALNDIHEVRLELNKALAIEEDMWLQRSRNSWLKAGDKNTTFFHTKASNRMQRNTIARVLDSNNVWIEDEEQIGHEFVQYFAGLFTSSNPRIEGELIDAIQPKVLDRMNASLIREF
ncbi:uncharacterized protein LOC126722089 [Quercus robur]|uniref:uncharacterized protein LOC126722089 n=1 Tax=Quercus robur TaxID=38942 RepID=UPI002163417A|nr:uncharacterized protein LOC126722089 [Quercus robur]